MEKFVVIYMACGHDGEDGYCFGNTDIIAVKDTPGEAELIARQEINNLVESFVNVDPDEFDESMQEEYEALVEHAKEQIYVEEKFDENGLFEEARIEADDDEYPHLGVVKLIKISV